MTTKSFVLIQSSVPEQFNLIQRLTKITNKDLQTKISAEVRAIDREVKEQTPPENLLDKLDEKIKEAEAQFEAKS